MAFYTTRPQTIEAIQWTGDNLKEISHFIWIVSPYLYTTWPQIERYVENHELYVDIQEKAMKVSIGDFIVKDEDGVYSVMDPVNFNNQCTKQE